MVEAIVPSLHASMSYKYKGNNMTCILSNYNTSISLNKQLLVEVCEIFGIIKFEGGAISRAEGLG